MSPRSYSLGPCDVRFTSFVVFFRCTFYPWQFFLTFLMFMDLSFLVVCIGLFPIYVEYVDDVNTPRF